MPQEALKRPPKRATRSKNRPIPFGKCIFLAYSPPACSQRPRRPKRLPRRPRRPPGGLQDGPRRAQDGPRDPLDSPRESQDRPKRGPRAGQPSSNFEPSAPRGPQEAPRGPQEGPKRLQEAQRGPQEAPKRPHEARNLPPIQPREASKMLPIRSPRGPPNCLQDAPERLRLNKSGGDQWMSRSLMAPERATRGQLLRFSVGC